MTPPIVDSTRGEWWRFGGGDCRSVPNIAKFPLSLAVQGVWQRMGAYLPRRLSALGSRVLAMRFLVMFFLAIFFWDVFC
jgi:hypothetical protein